MQQLLPRKVNIQTQALEFSCHRDDFIVPFKIIIKSLLNSFSNNVINANFDATFNESTENNFNQFYVKSVESIVESIPTASFTEKQLITEVTQVECKFKFKQIEMSELVNIVKNLKSTAVPNNVTLNVLLNILETIYKSTCLTL